MNRAIIFTVVFLLLRNAGFAQHQSFQFNTAYYDAVDKWIAFDKKDGDSSYTFGFIYIDEQAGFTFDYESSFKVSGTGLQKLPRAFESSVKSRLAENTAKVMILTEEQQKQLQLPRQPEWLQGYKTNENELSYLVRIGYLYNHVGASHRAITPLLKAYNREPQYPGLEFELAFAYNATQNYNKAATVLNKAIEKDSLNFWYYRELGYSYKNLGQLEEAEGIYRRGIQLSSDKGQQAEMAINMVQSYFKVRNKKKFDEWVAVTRKYAEKGSQFLQYIDYYENNWEKK